VLRIATRRSPLALAQAREVAGRLSALGVRTELVPMVTSGDTGASAAGSPAGVKGLFVDEIVRALRAGEVDLAVHSAKDLPARDPDGVIVAAVPERADPSDVLVTRDGGLPEEGVVGTSSLRRRAQVLRWRPRLSVRDLRGNVDTRLRKLADGETDALILAAAGLDRLGMAPPNTERLQLRDMVPAPGQGALAVQARGADASTLAVVRELDHLPSRTAFDAERGLVARLGGGCALPLGALARVVAGGVEMTAIVATPSGSEILRTEVFGAGAAAAAEAAARDLLAGGAGRILSEAAGAGR
jgi:hydroxymethylbilane synthase